MSNKLILEFPGFIPMDKVHWLRETMKANSHLYQGSSYNREGDTVSISERAANTPELKSVEEYLIPVFAELANKIAPVYRPKYATGDSGYEYHLYPPGKICKEHADGEVILGGNIYNPSEFLDASLLRYATAVIYLTTNEGGELVFPDFDVRITPQAGKAVVFPPYGPFIHHVTPAKEDREILMTWFVYNNINARFV